MSKDLDIKIEKDEIPVEDIKELFEVINKEIPGLIKGLLSSLYSAETAEQYAKGIGIIYKTLTEQGLPPAMVDELVKKYANSINLIGNAVQNIKINDKKRDRED
ncbi:MAG: hypothetical protein ACFFDW_07650 [Candidatus Thorarchaeota archaeon]